MLASLLAALLAGPAAASEHDTPPPPAAEAETVAEPSAEVVAEPEPEAEAVAEDVAEAVAEDVAAADAVDSDPVIEPEPEPEPRSAPTPARPTPSEPPRMLAPTVAAKPPPPPRYREGVFASAFVGYMGCLTDFCQGYRGGAFGTVEVGYRHRLIGGFVGAGGGGGPGDTPAGLRFSITDLHVHAGLMMFFARKSIVDPYASFSLGWDRTAFDGDALSRLTFSRGAVRFSAGVLFFVHPSVELGPRFDIALPFAGKACADGGMCAKIADLEQNSGFNFDARDLPRIFTFSVGGRFTFPVRPPKPDDDPAHDR